MSTQTSDIPTLISLHEAAQILGISHAAARRLVQNSQLPAYQLPSGEYRVAQHELGDWLESLRTVPAIVEVNW
jgi:excisionase family DNA binding protein